MLGRRQFAIRWSRSMWRDLSAVELYFWFRNTTLIRIQDASLLFLSQSSSSPQQVRSFQFTHIFAHILPAVDSTSFKNFLFFVLVLFCFSMPLNPCALGFSELARPTKEGRKHSTRKKLVSRCSIVVLQVRPQEHNDSARGSGCACETDCACKAGFAWETDCACKTGCACKMCVRAKCTQHSCEYKEFPLIKVILDE